MRNKEKKSFFLVFSVCFVQNYVPNWNMRHLCAQHLHLNRNWESRVDKLDFNFSLAFALVEKRENFEPLNGCKCGSEWHCNCFIKMPSKSAEQSAINPFSLPDSGWVWTDFPFGGIHWHFGFEFLDFPTFPLFSVLLKCQSVTFECISENRK